MFATRIMIFLIKLGRHSFQEVALLKLYFVSEPLTHELSQLVQLFETELIQSTPGQTIVLLLHEFGRQVFVKSGNKRFSL